MLCIVLWIPAFAERTCATVVSSSYSAWRFPSVPLDFVGQVRGDGLGYAWNDAGLE